MDFLTVLQQAVAREEGVFAQRALVSRVLSTLGHREQPEQQRTPEGLVLVWRGTPAGDVVLSGGKISGAPAAEPPAEPSAASLEEASRTEYGATARASALPEDRKKLLTEAATRLRQHFLRRFTREEEIRRERDEKYRLQEEARAARAAQRSQKGPGARTRRG